MRSLLIVAIAAVACAAVACGARDESPREGASRRAADDDVVTETVYSGVATTRAIVELAGGLRLTTDGSQVTWIEFEIALAAGAQPMQVTGPDGHIEVSYIDATIVVDALTYFIRESVGDADGLLEPGESATIRIDVADACPDCAIGPDHTFTLVAKPSHGSYLVMQRTTPSTLAPSIDLN